MRTTSRPPRLLVVGLSPAWQRTYRVDSLRPGELIRSSSVAAFASGKATNAARHAANRLAANWPAANANATDGGHVTLVTPLGGLAGDLFRQDIVSREAFALAATQSASATRTCTSILEADGRATELIENASPLASDEQAAILEAISDAPHEAIAICGSLPPGCPDDFLAACLDRSPASVRLVDAAGPPLLAALAAGPSLAKPNADELARTVGRPLRSDAEIEAAARGLQRRHAVDMLVTNGSARTLLLCNGASAWLAPPPPRQIVSAIGAGDAIAGSLLADLASGVPTAAAADRALSYAAAYLEVPPPTLPSLSNVSPRGCG